MNWSKRAHLITLNSYSLADWLIDIGGISRAIYIGGLVAAHFIAQRMYKAALIQDIFMVHDQNNHQSSQSSTQRPGVSSELGKDNHSVFADVLAVPQYERDIQTPRRSYTAPLKTQETLYEDTHTVKSSNRTVQKQDPMRELFLKAVNTGGLLQKEHVLDLVNTIIGRKRASFSLG